MLNESDLPASFASIFKIRHLRKCMVMLNQLSSACLFLFHRRRFFHKEYGYGHGA
ncbi:hypothetical protein B4096_2491 [Heyndrickxia coagulans]|uniref:Uncharacterized protein n=1 Tax=Heyndrickxia coagulans TaxID=1398 RepID=A0A133KA38_HEYCO|nr:hypothetical protein BCO26_2100 [Heyndrickxia coagulans 2-6]KWZ76400.1 hypothetical protein HMPREF3213_03840 [Heyndrickxia coagulans]KYC58849.1 hypothetical protein B4098_2367 [Heyndrickxia coagulans]KYC59537.1 hypothetical protein B4100_2576 [Heyndrickxia coagulans]KYC66718.1 hypothetical protein B4099_2459 [Heyndrickxia coagulans]